MRIKRVSRKARDGCGLQGYLRCGYADLVEVFGEPNIGASMDGKVQAEWALSWNGVVFTIYDYKAGIPVEAIHSWHVGGRSRKAWLACIDCLESMDCRVSGFSCHFRVPDRV